jgi:hypothetical protein
MEVNTTFVAGVHPQKLSNFRRLLCRATEVSDPMEVWSIPVVDKDNERNGKIL